MSQEHNLLDGNESSGWCAVVEREDIQEQGSTNSVLEGQCPAELSSKLPQHTWTS